MLLAVSLNCSVDIAYSFQQLTLDAVNRTEKVEKTAGGKGLNVARVASLAGAELITTGFLGGFLGDFIQSELKATQIPFDFVAVEGETRNCIAIVHDDQQTEILEAGPTLTTADDERMVEKIRNLFEHHSIQVMTLSGSIPKGIDSTIYKRLIQLAHEKKVQTIVDASGLALQQVIEASTHPTCITPNLEELSAYLNMQLQSKEEIKSAIEHHPHLQRMPSILVTLGAEGALAKVEKQWFDIQVPEIEVVSAVGSGDAVVAGVATAWLAQKSIKETLTQGMTFGILNAKQMKTGWVNMKNFAKIARQIHIRKL